MLWPILNFPHKLQLAHLVSGTRFEARTSQTQNKNASPSPPTLCLTKTAYHIICNTTTPIAYYSVFKLIYNTPHSTLNVCRSYLRCLLSGATINTALVQNVWSGLQHQDPVFISSRSKSWTTHTRKNLISQRPQMPSAVNIKMAL
jgi:hypothetical protein